MLDRGLLQVESILREQNKNFDTNSEYYGEDQNLKKTVFVSYYNRRGLTAGWEFLGELELKIK